MTFSDNRIEARVKSAIATTAAGSGSFGPRAASMSALISRIASRGRARSAGGDAVPAAAVSLRLTTDQPGAATGMFATIDFPLSEFGRPYSVRQIGVRFPPGFTVDFDAVPLCDASNAALYRRGVEPWSASIVGSATAEVDLGWRNSERLGGPFHQFVLGDGEFICYERNQLGTPGPDGRTVFPLVFRTPVDDSGFVMTIPEAPSFRKPDGLHALKSVELSFPGTGAFRTPEACPATGVWPFTITFDYYVGASHSVIVEVPCAGRR